MAKQQQDWKNALQAAKPERGGPDDRVDPRETKKKSRLMFRKRKLDKDVKKYINGRIRINSSDIEAIGRRHGFQCLSLGEQPEGDGK